MLWAGFLRDKVTKLDRFLRGKRERVRWQHCSSKRTTVVLTHITACQLDDWQSSGTKHLRQIEKRNRTSYLIRP